MLDGCWTCGPKYVTTVGQAYCLEVQGNPGANAVVDEAHGKEDFGAEGGPTIPCEQCLGGGKIASSIQTRADPSYLQLRKEVG